jgi:hypothetical protein
VQPSGGGGGGAGGAGDDGGGAEPTSAAPPSAGDATIAMFALIAWPEVHRQCFLRYSSKEGTAAIGWADRPRSVLSAASKFPAR